MTWAMIRDAFRLYGRHFWEFLLTGALLPVPISAIAILQSKIAIRPGWQRYSSGASLVLTGVEVFALLVGTAALTVLAADLQTGGRSGWREAWSRALSRARPIVTGNLACAALLAIGLAPLLYVLVAIPHSLNGPWSSIALTGLAWPLIPIGAMVAPVAVFEKQGGFRALRRGRALLKTGAFLALALVNVFYFAGTLFAAALPTHPSLAQALTTAVNTLGSPLSALVALSAYRAGRARETGYSDAQLKADLDAI